MKKTYIITAIILFMNILGFSQTGKQDVEVLYFKANLGCCMARSCNALETDIQKVISTNYPKGNVKFSQIKLVDPANEALVKKYDAKSQTVILVKNKKGKETSVDISASMREYMRTQDYAAFEKTMVEKINSIIK